MRRYSHSPRRRAYGFSLVELVVVIAITGVIAATVGIFILRPVQGYNAQVRRAELVDAAESALRRMQRDIRASLPNSVRIRTNGATTGDATCPNGGDTVCVIEMLHAVDGARYRAGPPGAETQILRFDGTDIEFDAVSSFQNGGVIDLANNPWVVVNNQTASPAVTEFNAYNCPAALAGASHNCVRMAAASTPLTDPPHIVLGAAFTPVAPSLASQRQRFFVVDMPVTYRCDTTTGRLERYQAYAIALAHPVTPAGVPARVADLVTRCRFTYTAGTTARSGLLTLELTLTDPNVNGQQEQIRLLHQVHVYNVP